MRAEASGSENGRGFRAKIAKATYMNEKLKEKIREALVSVLPITVIVLILSVSFVPMEVGTVSIFLTGAVCLIIGMGFFQLGAEMAMTPFGQGIGSYLTKRKKLWLLLLCSFVMGVLITVAEPDLQVLANQVASVPNYVLILSVALGVGFFLTVAVLRIYKKISLSRLLMILYGLLFLLSVFAPSSFIAVAFDAGGVTTGPVTVPFIMALGVGLAAVRNDRDSASDSFGLIALCSIGPIMTVMILGICYNPTEALYNIAEIAPVITTQDVFRQFVVILPQYMAEVGISILPVVLLFFIFEAVTRYFRKQEMKKMCVGMVYTYIGLVLFLTGVNVGFAPVGNLLGHTMAESSYKWLLIPLGAVIGYYIVKAEPAVHVLNAQVEEITGGTVTRGMMNIALSASISCAVALAMARAMLGFSIYWIIVPGYALALVLSLFVSPVFVGIAFDSGGVASGPMTSTFLLPLSIGVCIAAGGNVASDAFGVIALVALAPLISIQIMGIIYQLKSKRHPGKAEINEQIIDLEEEDI